ncbi:MAG: preprotein translocase subunit SecG [Victivallaceae bacterium]
MGVLSGILYTAVIIVGLLMIGLVLIQKSKGGGFGGSFGGVGESIFGAHAGSHLTKMTVVMTTLFFVLALVLTVIVSHVGKGSIDVKSLENDKVITGESMSVPDDAATVTVPVEAGKTAAPETAQ